MAYRKRMSRGKSKRVFGRTARGTQSANLIPTPMRGGFRF